MAMPIPPAPVTTASVQSGRSLAPTFTIESSYAPTNPAPYRSSRSPRPSRGLVRRRHCHLKAIKRPGHLDLTSQTRFVGAIAQRSRHKFILLLAAFGQVPCGSDENVARSAGTAPTADRL